MTVRDPGPPSEMFFAGDHQLEGVFEEAESGQSWGGVVVAHPHPLYGGTMAQPVVHRVAKNCREKGLATLRFNFPGVGRSGGRYTGKDEHLDVEAALVHLQDRLGSRLQRSRGDESSTPFPTPTSLPVGLVGYSFGSVMAAAACCGRVPVRALALIAFPVQWEEDLLSPLKVLGGYRGPVLAVCGENDDISPPAAVKGLLTDAGLDLTVEAIPGAGHLFEQSRARVSRAVAEFMARELSL